MLRFKISLVVYVLAVLTSACGREFSDTEYPLGGIDPSDFQTLVLDDVVASSSIIAFVNILDSELDRGSTDGYCQAFQTASVSLALLGAAESDRIEFRSETQLTKGRSYLVFITGRPDTRANPTPDGTDCGDRRVSRRLARVGPDAEVEVFFEESELSSEHFSMRRSIPTGVFLIGKQYAVQKMLDDSRILGGEIYDLKNEVVRVVEPALEWYRLASHDRASPFVVPVAVARDEFLLILNSSIQRSMDGLRI